MKGAYRQILFAEPKFVLCIISSVADLDLNPEKIETAPTFSYQHTKAVKKNTNFFQLLYIIGTILL